MEIFMDRRHHRMGGQGGDGCYLSQDQAMLLVRLFADRS